MDLNKDVETNKSGAQHDDLCRRISPNYLVEYQNHLIIRSAINRGSIEVLGPKHLQIFKVTLPFDATHVFQKIMEAYDTYDAQRNALDQDDCMKREPSLYSLTKRDVALVDLPGNMLGLVQGIQTYINAMIQNLYHIPFSQRLHLDRHQPHVLKYDSFSERSFRSVPLHHDCCHVTVNMTMNSRAANDYIGGGTYFLDLDRTVFCEPNEFLLHPGYAVHAGLPITSGSRFLLISFINFLPWTCCDQNLGYDTTVFSNIK